MGAFPRSRDERQRWWDDHLSLQMILITAICICAGFLAGGSVLATLAGTAVFVPLVYVLARYLMHRQQRR